MMSDDVPLNPDGTLTGIKDREDVETWIRFLVSSQVGWNDCQLVYDDENLIIRVRWPDGEEVAFHCEIKRKMRLLAPETERN